MNIMRIQNVNLSTYANVNHKNNRKNITVENSATTPQTRLPYNYRYNDAAALGTEHGRVLKNS